jgi:hypothetical protein
VPLDSTLILAFSESPHAVVRQKTDTLPPFPQRSTGTLVANLAMLKRNDFPRQTL